MYLTVCAGSMRRSHSSARPQGSSAGGFRAAGLDDLIDIPNSDVDHTLNAGAFSPKLSGPGYRARPSFEGILDRSPTPYYGSQRVREPDGRTPRGRTPRESRDRGRRSGDGPPTRVPSRKSIEEAFGVQMFEPGQSVARTFVRPESPSDLLEYPVIFNPRVTMMVSITQPLYIGGGCIDGRLNVHIRGTRLDNIRLGRVSIDIAGVEGTI